MTTLNVTTTVDENNGTGELSLREAIIQANNQLGDDTIVLVGGQTYQLSLTGTNEDKSATGDLDILAGGKVTISVAGDSKATIDGSEIDRVLDVPSNLASLTLKNIVVTGGKTTFGSGGGICNEGNLELESSIVSGNAGPNAGSNGGAIFSDGSLNILNSTISGNSAVSGGGIYNKGIAKITNSTVSSNLASFSGGGIFNSSSNASLTITNSTISSNLSSSKGAGILNNVDASLTITNSTISSNLASFRGGGIYNISNGNLNIGNSIVAKNISSDFSDISVAPFESKAISQGNNLIASGNYFTFATTDKVGVDPLLGDLENNGGPTATHALLEGSPAIDTGSSTLTRDQRGFGRTGVADIGAFEYNGINDLIPPSVNSFSPADEATGILPTTDLVINFSEPIKKGNAGNISIKKVANNSIVESIGGGSNQITVNGSQAIINLVIDLAGGTDYYVEMTEGLVTDAIGNNFSGITGNTTWNFQTIVPPDTTPPKVSSFSPTDNATKVAVGANLVVNFDEDIKKGSTGNIVIKKSSDSSVLETIGVTSSKVTVSGNKLTINPTNNLLLNTDYYVEIGNGVIKDLAGNNYPGITGKTAWNFKSITATSGANKIIGTAGADIIDGLAGNDTITGLGSNDKLTGGDGADLLDGSAGNDTLIGSGGNDTFLVNAGNDRLTGGTGADKFTYNTKAVFKTTAVGVDTITDFVISQNDKIVLDKTTFPKITSANGTGFSRDAEFAKVNTNTAAAISGADIVYNMATGELFYNQNGTATGFGTGGKFAVLSNKPNLTENQFIIQA